MHHLNLRHRLSAPSPFLDSNGRNLDSFSISEESELPIQYK